MPNRMVYLAKDHLAKGSDVEYVRSNLERIDGIQIIEFGSNISPEDCVAMVVVTSATDIEPEDTIEVSKNVSDALENFLESNDPEYVYVYAGKENSEYTDDSESTYPFGYVLCDFDSDVCDLELSQSNGDILYWVALDVDSTGSWIKTPRHYQPEAQFKLPPPPSLEERKLGKMTGSKQEESTGKSFKSWYAPDSKRRLI